MSDEAPKSALELAMERLRQKDAEQGVSEQKLTDAQREEIAEIRRVTAARIAQEEILYKSKAGAFVSHEERETLDQQYRREVDRLGRERDRKIEQVRARA